MVKTTGMTSLLHFLRRKSRSYSRKPITVLAKETSQAFSELGSSVPLKPSAATTRPHMSTTPQTQTHQNSKYTNTGRRSGRKCIARYSRQRRRPGQKKAEDYTKTMSESIIPPATAITNIFNSKMKSLDQDGQAELTFRMWDILEGRQTTSEDITRTQLICTPDAVPAYTKRTIVTHDTAVHFESCPYCYLRRLEIVDDTGMPTCTECGVVAPPVFHFETPFKKGGGEGTENPHYSVVHKHVYDRMAHFKALLNSIQGLGRSHLCPKMMQALRDKVKEQYPCWPDHNWVTRTLKSLKQGKYIPQAIRIAAIINNRYSSPFIEEHKLNQLELGFVDVCKHFDDWIQTNKQVKRKNFMSYPYITHQLFTRLGLSHLCPFVKIIKSSARLEAQNMLWKGVCERANWPFVSLTN